MAGTPGPLMSPGPNQDSMGYNMTINGSDYNSPQVFVSLLCDSSLILDPVVAIALQSPNVPLVVSTTTTNKRTSVERER